MFKQFFLKKMVQMQMKNLPKDQQEKLMTLIENNPELFTKIAKEVQHKIKNENKDQMVAMMEVVKKYKDELQKAMGSLG
jgi:hypothetical protein